MEQTNQTFATDVRQMDGCNRLTLTPIESLVSGKHYGIL
jgi:hypothetical protein